MYKCEQAYQDIFINLQQDLTFSEIQAPLDNDGSGLYVFKVNTSLFHTFLCKPTHSLLNTMESYNQNTQQGLQMTCQAVCKSLHQLFNLTILSTAKHQWRQT